MLIRNLVEMCSLKRCSQIEIFQDNASIQGQSEHALVGEGRAASAAIRGSGAGYIHAALLPFFFFFFFGAGSARSAAGWDRSGQRRRGGPAFSAAQPACASSLHLNCCATLAVSPHSNATAAAAEACTCSAADQRWPTKKLSALPSNQIRTSLVTVVSWTTPPACLSYAALTLPLRCSLHSITCLLPILLPLLVRLLSLLLLAAGGGRRRRVACCISCRRRRRCRLLPLPSLRSLLHLRTPLLLLPLLLLLRILLPPIEFSSPSWRRRRCSLPLFFLTLVAGSAVAALPARRRGLCCRVRSPKEVFELAACGVRGRHALLPAVAALLEGIHVAAAGAQRSGRGKLLSRVGAGESALHPMRVQQHRTQRLRSHAD